MYGAAIDNPDDIFYKNREDEDLKLLLNAVEYHEPYNKTEH